VTAHAAYSAYGVVAISGTTPTDPFAYEGEWGYYLDRETGQYLCGARYYDVPTGRWLNRDPIAYAGGINLNGYCHDNPVNNADPTGFCDLPECVVELAQQAAEDGLDITETSTWESTPAKNWHSHHIFPQQFRDRFAKIGLDNIDRMQWKVPDWWHQAIHKGPGGGWWNEQWENFFNSFPKNTDPSPQECMRFMGDLLRKTGVNKIKHVIIYYK
jgi:RHS repeat-associated protein